MSGSDLGSTTPGAGPASPLVGRSSELDRLRQWLAETLGGSPRVVVITGEAGIGKSRLVSELIAEARAAGVRPFAGRCLEGSRSPLLSLAAVLDALRPDLEAYGSALSGAGTEESGAAAALVAHTARALMAAASDRPVLLVLEDAQWAEQATIELVAHVAATLAHEGVFREATVMLVVTVRPGGVPAPVERLISRLTRETIGRTLRLGGLDDLGVFDLLAAATGVRPSVGLLTLARDATSGNPLEIETLLTRLERVGALERRGRELASTIDDASALPPNLDVEVDVTRLEALSATAARLVTTLAMLRGAQFAVLEAAAGIETDEFDAAVDEATDAGLIVDDGARVDFVDPAIARALSGTMTGRRRQRIHADIANRLVAAGIANAHPSVVTEQLQRAGTAADPAVMATYARAAGDDAFDAGAWSDAVRHYEAALRDAELDDRQRAALEYRVALAAYRNIDTAAASAAASRAVELAERSGDVRTWGDAAVLHSRVTSDTTLIEHFLAAAGDREPGLRARMHAMLSELSFDRMQLDTAAAHSAAAQQVVATTDDPSAAARVEFVVALQRLGTLALDDATAHLLRSEEQARRAGDGLVEAWARGRQPLVAWSRGDLTEAAVLAANIAELDRASGWWAEYSLVTAARSGIAVAQGNLGAAERFGAEAASAHRRSEHGAVASLLWSTLASARLLLGDADGARAALAEWEREDPRPVVLYRMLVDARIGGRDAVNAAHVPALVRPGTAADLMSVSLAATAVELADAVEQPDIASGALDVLIAAYAKGIRFAPGWCAFVPRLAGVACLLAGAHTEAQDWLRTAEVDAERSGAAGEAARVRYDRARCLLASGEDASAALTTASEAFERLGYRQLVRAARRLAGKPDEGPSADSGATRVIMVTDIIDSTPLTRRVGDRRFVELLREHNRIVRARLQQFDGVEFKHTGDGIAAWFLSAGAAVECGLLIMEDLERANTARLEDPLFIRIGIAAGEVVSEGPDVFGLAVITAFRICDHARDGRIVVSKDVPPLARNTDIRFVAFGDVSLKGFSEPTALYAVEPNRR